MIQMKQLGNRLQTNEFIAILKPLLSLLDELKATGPRIYFAYFHLCTEYLLLINGHVHLFIVTCEI